MKEFCDECMTKLVGGILTAQYGVVFTRADESKKFFPKQSLVVCDCCPKCGMIYNIRLKDTKKVFEKKDDN